MLELLVVGANHVTMALVSHLLSQVHPCKSDESRKSAYLCDSDGDSDSLVEHGKHCEKEVTSPEKWLRDRMLVVDDDEVMPMDLESLPCPDVPFLLSAVVKIRPVACPCAAEPPLAFYHLPIAKFCDHFVVTLANGRELQARNVVVAGPRQTAVPKWAEQGRNGLVGKCQGCGRVVVIGNCLATCSQALTTFSHVVLLLPDHMAPEIKDPRVHSRRVRERPCRHVHHHLPHHYHVLSRAMQDGRLTVFECADVQGARYEENDGLWELWLSEGSWVVCEWVWLAATEMGQDFRKDPLLSNIMCEYPLPCAQAGRCNLRSDCSWSDSCPGLFIINEGDEERVWEGLRKRWALAA